MSAIPDTSIVLISWSPNDYRLRLLRQTLASLRAHTQRPHTLVVVDNGPADQTQVIESYAPDIHLRNEVNLGVGRSRNVGAAATASAYLAFTDSDIGFFPGWLNACIAVLEAYPDHRLVATAVKNKPMRLPKYQRGALGPYQLYARCAGMCLVMRRRDYEALGGFHELKANVGHQFCAAMRKRRYLFIHHPDWCGRHLGRARSYHYKKQVFVNGNWVPKGEQTV